MQPVLRFCLYLKEYRALQLHFPNLSIVQFNAIIGTGEPKTYLVYVSKIS